MPLGPAEYLESRGHRLYPVQRFILKLMYGEPLDSTSATINIRAPFSTESFLLTEAEYLRYLQRQDRINITDAQNPEGYRSTLIAAGRRSGKTQLLALMHAYEAYLFMEGSANRYAALSLTIQMELAKNNHRALRNILARDQIITRETSTTLTCGTPVRQASFVFRGVSNVGAHGVTLDSLIMDEAAYFWQSEVSPISAYAAIEPALSRLPDRPSRVTLVSTPNGHDSFFHQQYQYHMRNPDQGWLTLRVPTWEANPYLGDQTYRDQRPEYLERDFGASFDAQSMRSDRLIADEMLETVRAVAEQPVLIGPPKSRFHIIEEFTP